MGLAAAALLTGCAGSPPWGGWSKEPSEAKVQAALGRSRETYIYFSQYDVYRKTRSKQFVYQENGIWINSEQPPAGVPESALTGSPSVEVTMDQMPASTQAAATQPPREPAPAGTVVAGVQ